MAYKPDEVKRIFNTILTEIRKGRALRKILKDDGMIGADTFYDWLEKDKEKVELYARACEVRADAIFDEIIEIADDSSQDSIEMDYGDGVVASKFNSEFVQRSRLRVDARKWIASKLNPKKYGDRVELDNKHSGSVNIISLGSGTKPDESD